MTQSFKRYDALHEVDMEMYVSFCISVSVMQSAVSLTLSAMPDAETESKEIETCAWQWNQTETVWLNIACMISCADDECCRDGRFSGKSSNSSWAVQTKNLRVFIGNSEFQTQELKKWTSSFACRGVLQLHENEGHTNESDDFMHAPVLWVNIKRERTRDIVCPQQKALPLSWQYDLDHLILIREESLLNRLILRLRLLLNIWSSCRLPFSFLIFDWSQLSNVTRRRLLSESGLALLIQMSFGSV